MILGDYHVHSNYSKDAESPIEDNVKSAIEKGLREVVVSDHCFYHMYGINQAKLDRELQEIDELRKSSSITILKSVEANLMDQSGKIDLPKHLQDKLDVVVLGYHKSTGKGFFAKIRHAKMRGSSKKNIERNTQAYIKALTNNKINIVAHPNYAAPIDCVALARFCKEHNIYFELNGRKHCIDNKTFRQVIETGVMFIINSDAHNAVRVGDVRLGLTLMEKFNIPESQIANLNKIPDFSKRC